jgi:hypothetical protein
MDFHNSAVRIKHDVTFKDIVDMPDMPDMPAKTVSSSHLHLTLCCVMASLGERCGCGSDITGHHWHLGTWAPGASWAPGPCLGTESGLADATEVMKQCLGTRKAHE